MTTEVIGARQALSAEALALLEAFTQTFAPVLPSPGLWSADEEVMIGERVREQQILREVRQRVADASAPQQFAFEGGTLDRVWTAAPDPKPLVDFLLPEGGNLLLTAQRKSGKTLLAFNLAESLTTGKPFLGSFDTGCLRGRVGFLNYELTAGLVTDYTRGLITNPDRVLAVNLLGRINPLASDRGRAALASYLRAHSVEVLIVDPFSGAATGVDENSNSEVRQWLDDLHRWTIEDVGARALVLTNHAGWAADRSRGASSLEDWGNVLGLLTLADRENKSSARFFSAFGRLGEIPEDQLEFDPATKALKMSGVGGRRRAKAAAAASTISAGLLPFVTDVPTSGNALIKRAKDAGMQGARSAFLGAVNELLSAGAIENVGTAQRPKYRIAEPRDPVDPHDIFEDDQGLVVPAIPEGVRW